MSVSFLYFIKDVSSAVIGQTSFLICWLQWVRPALIRLIGTLMFLLNSSRDGNHNLC